MTRAQVVIAAAIGFGVSAGTALAQGGVEWPLSAGGNGHWYGRTPMVLRWPESNLLAQSLGGHLVSIASSEEQAFLYLHFREQSYWIGAHRSAANPAVFEWTDGTPWVFTNWRPFEPSNCNPCGNSPYVLDDALFPGWDDTGYFVNGDPNIAGLIGVIEWSADCDGDGIVDYGQIVRGERADADTDNIPDCCQRGANCVCPADVDFSGEVDGVDLSIVLTRWGTDGGKDYPAADIDGSDTIDGADLAAVLGKWGPCP